MKKLLRINLILTAVAVALVFTAQRLHSSMSFDDGICPPCIPPRCLTSNVRMVIDQHPHPSDNRWYFVCDGGEAFCMRCGDGLTYNPMTQCCDSVNPVDAPGENPGAGDECPNGGYWSTGVRDGVTQRFYELMVDTGGGYISFGLFNTNKLTNAEVGANGWKFYFRSVPTKEYTCDNSNNNVCLVCNQYRI